MDAGVGVASYEVQASVNGGTFKRLYRGSATSAQAFYPFAKSLVWRVRATDKEGNTSAWATASARRIVAFQDGNRAIAYRGAWNRVHRLAASGSGYRLSTASTARARLAFKGREVLYVAPRTRAGGSVKVYVDGVRVGTYKLSAKSNAMGRIITRAVWATSGSHRIWVVNARGGKAVNFDAFLVLK